MRTQDQNVREASFRFQVEVEIPVAEHQYSFPGRFFFIINPFIHDYLCRPLDRELLTKLHLRIYRLNMASKVSAKFPQPEELL